MNEKVENAKNFYSLLQEIGVLFIEGKTTEGYMKFGMILQSLDEVIKKLEKEGD